jgi:hypothetical protein
VGRGTVRSSAAAAALAGLLACAPSAEGAIAFVASSTAQTSTGGATSLTIGAPTGVVAGELEIASVSTQGTSVITPPSGWTQIIDTQVGTSLQQASFWHLAGASEGTSTWTFGSSSKAAGGIVAYSGVDTTSIVDAAAAQTGTSGTSATIPSVASVYSGDLVLGIGSFNNSGTLIAGTSTTKRYSSTLATTNGPALLAQDATHSSTGATAAQTITDLSSATAWAGQVIALKAASATGVLSVQTSASPTFSTSLDSGDHTPTYAIPLTTTGSVSPATGWNETITSTQFSSGTHTLSTSASTIGSAPTATCDSQYANCSPPTNAVTYPVAVPAAAVAPSAIKFFDAATGTGAGEFTITPTITVTVPQNTFAGTYTSTVTIAIVSGP